MKSINDLGFQKPSAIQAQALPLLLGEPTDFLGLAATGTGKTAAFAIPMLEKIPMDSKGVQALVLCPTRELAMQVAGQINLLGKYKGIQALPIYGGSSFGDQVYGLKSGARVVVGTPGRVIDHIERGTLKLETVQILVLDEADEMISMGFREDLETIMEKTNRDESNIWLFSATMSKDVRKVADKYLRDPKQVQVNKTEMLSSTVKQIYYMARESDKPEILCKLIDFNENFYGLVFCQTKNLVTDLTKYLMDRGYRADCLHGDKDQTSRERTMKSFRDRKIQILICTDVASRGLDVQDITHVINYSLPRELDNYVHRIGRTARSGKEGIAMNLVTPSHRPLVDRIERMTKSRMTEGQLPTRKEIGSKKVSHFLAQFEDQKNAARAIELMGPEWESALESLTAKDVAGRFLAMMFPEVFTQGAKPFVAATPKSQTASSGFGSSSSSSSEQPRRERYGHRGDRDQQPRYGRPPSSDRRRSSSSEGASSSYRSDRSERSEYPRPSKFGRASGERSERSERPRFSDRSARSEAPRTERSDRVRSDRSSDRPEKKQTSYFAKANAKYEGRSASSSRPASKWQERPRRSQARES